MALGRQKQERQDQWVSASDLPTSPGHPFYVKLNSLLDEAGFDEYVEQLCAGCHADAQRSACECRQRVASAAR